MGESIRIQTLDGQWETLGLVRSPRVMPESIAATANDWGPDQLTCTLQRDPAELAADLSTWTPVELEIDGTVVWDGRVKEAPKQGGPSPQVSLVCEGWQYHLDDSLYQDMYTTLSLADFVDTRSLLAADLTKFVQIATVSTDPKGAPVIGFPGSTAVTAGWLAGITMDLGPIARAKQWWIWPNDSLSVGFPVFMRGSDTDVSITSGTAGSYEDIGGTSTDLASLVAPMGGTFNSPRRYLTLILAIGGTGTLGGDVWLKLVSSLIVSVSAVGAGVTVSGGAANLTADKVIRDAVNRGTVLLSRDRTGIANAGFNILSLDFRNTPRTPRDVWSDVNNLHGFCPQVAVGRVPLWYPRPTTPFAVVRTTDHGVDWNDASSGSGADIVNHVIVTGTDGSGKPLRLERYATDMDVAPGGLPWLSAVGVSLSNPSATTNTTGWTQYSAAPSSISRTTTAGEFTSSPGGFKFAATGFDNPSMYTTLTGTFRAGLNYAFGMNYKTAATDGWVNLWLGDGGIAGVTLLDNWVQGPTPVNTFHQIWFSWIPQYDVANVTLWVQHWQESTAFSGFFDDFIIQTAQPTLADRRGFKRTQVLSIGSPTDLATMDQLATLFLQQHSATPFRGGCTISAPDVAQDPRSGRSIPPHEFLEQTTSLLRFGDLVDPDTGGMGRDGIIRTASHQNGVVQLTIDNTNTSLENLLARMAVVQGQ